MKQRVNIDGQESRAGVAGETMTVERTSSAEWENIFKTVVEDVRRVGRSRVVSVSIAASVFDPIDVYAAARSRDEAAMLWQLPSRGVALVGVGVEAELTGEGDDRFADIARQWTTLIEGALVIAGEEGTHTSDGTAATLSGDGSPTHPGPGPVALGGFAFAPGGAGGPWTGFGDGRLRLPRATYGIVGDRGWLTVNTVVSEATAPDEAARALRSEWARWSGDEAAPTTAEAAEASAEEAAGEGGLTSAAPIGAETEIESLPEDMAAKERWLAAVERVAADIRKGALEKAVLARSVRLPVSDGFSTASALRRLRTDYPETYVFAIGGEDGDFLGATPERIVHLAGDVVKVACMAGSIGRGETEAEDRALGAALLADPKNVEEHKVVLRSILDALAPVCDAVTAGAEPGLRKFANVQHLYTPVSARRRPGVDVLELVSRVHPTPAIGGHPTEDALQLITKEEQLHRGWYAGPVGWMNERGEGEFAVGLRSGLLKDGEAHLFAGCGIMGDSDPESEYVESVLKLRAMMRALEAGKR